MRILIDNREQKPFTFTGFGGLEIEASSLPTGDYSLPGFENRAAIERKGLEDLIDCLKVPNRKRFEQELTRAGNFELFAVVVEASLEDVSLGRYRSAMNPHSALQSIFAFQVRYRVPFIWAGSRTAAEYVTYGLLEKYAAEIEKRYKRLNRNQENRAAGRKTGTNPKLEKSARRAS